jgi:hypothetical protein
MYKPQRLPCACLIWHPCTFPAARANNLSRLAGDLTGRQVVDDILQRAAAEGLTTIRVWAHTQASFVPFQILPGQYSERGLKGLDYTLDAARRAGLQVRRSLRGRSWPHRAAIPAQSGHTVHLAAALDIQLAAAAP